MCCIHFKTNEQKWLRYQREENEKVCTKIVEELKAQEIRLLDKNKMVAEEYSNKLRKQLGERLEKFYELMLDLGWPPHLEMDVSEARKIIDISVSYDEKVLKKAINDHYINKYNTKVINGFLNKWGQNRIFRKRILILEQAINAHIIGNYFLSTCTLISQLEGIIADSENHIGKMRESKLKEYLGKRVVGREKYSFGYAFKRFYNKKLYCNFEHGRCIASPISRHAILHGADIVYGTEVNSLKVILISDNLFHYFA